MKTRDELVRIAHAAAAAIFVGARKSITANMMQRARIAAYDAISRADRAAGTKDHPFAAYSFGIVALADEGVAQARDAWAKIRAEGGAAGIRSRIAGVERQKSDV